MKIYKPDELNELENGNIEVWVRFDYEGEMIGVIVELFPDNEIILHREGIQYFDNDNWFDYKFSEKEYNYWHSKLEKYFDR